MDTLLTILDWMAFTTGLIGAPLGLIEIFRPDLADKIERWLDHLDGGDEEGALEKAGKQHMVKYSMLVFITFPLLIFLLYCWESQASPMLPTVMLPSWGVTMIIGVIIASMFGVVLHGVAVMINGLNKMTNGQALGGFGVLLIILGVIGDVGDKLLSWIVE